MRQIFILIALLVGAHITQAQNKLFLKKGLKRVVVKPGKDIGITEKGESFRYANWKSVCSGCYIPGCMDSTYPNTRYQDSSFFYYRDCRDTGCVNTIWRLDSIKDNSIVLRRLSSDSTKFRLDTVAISDYDRYVKKLEKQHEEPAYIQLDSTSGEANIINLSYIVMVPTDYDRKTIPIDSVASVTFSREDHCATFHLGVPLMAAVLAIASPIVAADKDDYPGKYGWPVLIVGEAAAGLLTWAMIRNINSLKVRTYNLEQWKVKTR